MSTMWILTGNRSFAKIFEVKGLGRHVKEIYHLDNQEAHKKKSEIFSDRPGRSTQKTSVHRHALTTEIDGHEHEQKVFAEHISAYLQEGFNNKHYDELAFIGPAHFLNSVNHALAKTVQKCVVKEISKDLPEYLSEQDRIDHLCKYLDLWNRNPVGTA